MSEIFHKSCYTSRSSGYKYRTLSTNTGERKQRDNKDDTTFDRKFKELKQEITSRINKEVDDTQIARESIKEKIEKIDAKISSMLDLQTTVTTLRNDLSAAESALILMTERVENLFALTGSESFSTKSRKSTFLSQDSITEEGDSIITRLNY